MQALIPHDGTVQLGTVEEPELSADEAFRQAFGADAVRAAKSLWHPNIARVAEVGEASGFLYLALDLAGAVCLEQLTRRAREVHLWPLPPVLAVQLVMPVCAALEYAYVEGKLFHR